MVLRLLIKHGQSTHQIEAPEDAAVVQVMEDIEKVTGVPTRHQKLICQGRVVDPTSTLKALKLKTGAKLMLMTSGSQTQVLLQDKDLHACPCIL